MFFNPCSFKPLFLFRKIIPLLRFLLCLFVTLFELLHKLFVALFVAID